METKKILPHRARVPHYSVCSHDLTFSRYIFNLFYLGCCLCGSISFIRFVFFGIKNECPCLLCGPNIYAKSDRKKKHLRIQWTKSSGFDPIFDELGHQISGSNNGMLSTFKDVSYGSKQEQNDRLVGWRHSCIATLFRPRRAVGGWRVSPWRDCSRLAWARV